MILESSRQAAVTGRPLPEVRRSAARSAAGADDDLYAVFGD